MTQLKQQLLRYGLAMNASAFDAAIHSCAAFFGVAGAHAAVESIPVLNLQQLAAVFLISFARGLLNYLDTHPVAALVGDEVTSLKSKESQSLLTSAPTSENS